MRPQAWDSFMIHIMYGVDGPTARGNVSKLQEILKEADE